MRIMIVSKQQRFFNHNLAHAPNHNEVCSCPPFPYQTQMNPTKLTRRSFLKTAARATIASTLASQPFLPAAEAPTGRRIGFVDLNLDNYHANVFLQALRGPLATRGFSVTGSTGTKTAESRAWSEKNNVPFFDNDTTLNAAVDFFMVLAPSNP